MPATLNFFDTYTLMAINEEVTPVPSFFKDRYFPTGEGDIFAADKVLTEYRKGDRKMAAFISDRAGDIPMDRRGYAIHEYQPARIAPSRLLTADELAKRGFGEAIYANSTPAQRAARLLRDDMTDMERRIVSREEWMCAQVMINNACTMQTTVWKQLLQRQCAMHRKRATALNQKCSVRKKSVRCGNSTCCRKARSLLSARTTLRWTSAPAASS